MQQHGQESFVETRSGHGGGGGGGGSSDEGVVLSGAVFLLGCCSSVCSRDQGE